MPTWEGGGEKVDAGAEDRRSGARICVLVICLRGDYVCICSALILLAERE